jgi:hypothetical protein
LTNIELLLALIDATAMAFEANALPKVRHGEEVGPWNTTCEETAEVLDDNQLPCVEMQNHDMVSDLGLEAILILCTAACHGFDDHDSSFLLAFEARWVRGDDG